MVKKTTAQQIQDVADQLDAAITAVGKLSKRSEITKTLVPMKASISSAIEHLTNNEKRKYIDVRKSLKAAHNVIDGILEGLSSGDMSRSEFKGSLNTLRTRFYTNVCTSLSVEIEREEEASAKAASLSEEQEALKEQLSQSGDMKEALTVVRKAVKTQDAKSESPTGEITDVATHNQLTQLAETRKQLPIRLKSEFQLIRMPIVPIFSTYQMNNPATFARIGLKHVLIEGYAVILDQVLVAVSLSKAARAGFDAKQYAESVVSLLNERSTVEYEFVSDQPISNPRNTDIQLFWLLPKQKMSVMMQVALTGRNASTVKWGLPF